MDNIHSNARERILLTAMKLFAQQGFEATTVRQICKEAKTNLALVSYHFGGKESVFFALFEAFFPNHDFGFDKSVSDPVQDLKSMIKNLITFKLQQPDLVTIIQQEILMNSPRLKGMCKYMYPLYDNLKQVLEAGKVQGIFHYDSLDNTMLFVMAVNIFPVNNAFIRPLLSDAKQEPDSLFAETLNFVFNGLRYKG